MRSFAPRTLRHSYDSIVVRYADYAFLAGLAYQSSATVAQSELNSWFGDGQAIYDDETVQAYRNDRNVSSAGKLPLGASSRKSVQTPLSNTNSRLCCTAIIVSSCVQTSHISQQGQLCLRLD